MIQQDFNMPKLGLKYFAGSFFLSIAAVFIASKAYIVMSLNEQQEEEQLAGMETRNIELFAANEESDPIYEKFKKLSAADTPLSENAEHYTFEDLNTVDNSTINGDTILYASDEVEENLADNTENTATDNSTVTAENDSVSELIVQAETEETTTEEELQIADASTAPVFAIPLKHNYKTENGVVTVSDQADKGQIALASKNVSIYNMGAENQAEITEPLSVSEEKTNSEVNEENTEISANAEDDDNPWAIAEAANKHISKNTLATQSDVLEKDVNLPDAEAETQTAYKMQQNILIPIPEDILNDENLTPQFSTSEENLRLEEELRAKNKLPPLEEDADKVKATKNKSGSSDAIPSIDDEKDFDEEPEEDELEDEQTSQSFKDSISAWFAGIKDKASDITSSSAKKGKDKSSENRGGSIFQRLLGDKDKDIMPTELKLAFQPNRAEISGQTLDWLHAFADNALQHENVVVEIRVDRSASRAIQQKRLTMLYKIFADNGVEPKKINIIFTDREPNSFIIRNVRYSSDEERIEASRRIGNPWYKF